MLNKNTTYEQYKPKYFDEESLYDLIIKKYENEVDKNTDLAKTEFQFINSKENKELYLAGIKFDFTSDFWDFSSIRAEGKKKHLYRYDFSSVDPQYKTLLKIYTLYLINQYGITKSTGKPYFAIAKDFLTFCLEEKIDIEDISKNDIKDFLLNRKATAEKTYSGIKYKIKYFLEFYSLTINDALASDVEDYLTKVDTSLVASETESNKTPLLPTVFYAKLRDIFYSNFWNKDLDKMERAMSGLCYIDMQIGIRPEELTIFRYNDLKKEVYKGKKYALISYRQTKNVRNSYEQYFVTDIAINEKCTKIFEELIVMFDKERKEKNSDLLVININTKCDYFYLPDGKLSKFLSETCIKNAEKLEIINNEDVDAFERHFTVRELRKGNRNISANVVNPSWEDDDIISLPGFKQFRVYVTSESLNRGDDIRLISQQHGHLGINDDYYARYKESIQDESRNTEEFEAEGIDDSDYYLERLEKLKKEGGIRINTDGPQLYLPKGICGKVNYERQCSSLPEEIDTKDIENTCYNLVDIYKHNINYGYEEEARHTFRELEDLIKERERSTYFEQNGGKDIEEMSN